LTFVTPALIAGDKSLANVIAHEISHSWAGNLVTNQNWQMFWLNEGFTVFMEQKIAELKYGMDMYNLEANIGYADLKQTIKDIGETHSYTSLFPDNQNHDPDDAFSTVPYQKGFIFLYYLQDLTGKPVFQKILQNYMAKFKYTSITTQMWQDHFTSQVKELLPAEQADKILKEIDWVTWITAPGFPIKTFDWSSDLVNKAKDLAAAFLKKTPPSDAKATFTSWHTNTKLVFLNTLIDSLNDMTDDVYNLLRDTLKLYENQNAEVLNDWYLIGLSLKKDDIKPYAISFLSKFGRMKYIRPLYAAFYKFNKTECLKVFNQYKAIYHPIAVRLIEQDFQKVAQLKFLLDQ